MWYRVGIVSFTTLALLVFVVLGAALISLSAAFVLDTFAGVAAGFAYTVLFTVLLIVTFGFLALTVFQFGYHLYTARLDAQSRREVSRWKRVWAGVLFDDAPTPKTTDPYATLALLELRETLLGADATRLAQCYQETGLLARDLALLKRPISLEARAQVLERLALVRHTGATEALLNETRHADPDLRYRALLALARTYAATATDDATLIRLFLPLCDSGRFSIGLVEGALTLLEANASPILKVMTDPERQSAAVFAALNVIGRAGLTEGAAWCLPWLHSPLEEVRAAALKALANLHTVPAGSEHEVTRLLKDPVWFVRAQAASACAVLTGDTVTRALMAALGDRAWWVRRNAAQALTARGEGAARALLWAADNHPDRYARDMARQTLPSQTPPSQTLPSQP